MPEEFPQRIVSLVPSLTELLADLGLEQRLVGRTRFCIKPERISDSAPIIGGTKNPNIDKIKALSPDLVIANREENRKEDVEALEAFTDVHLTDIATIEDAQITIHELGSKLGVSEAADTMVSEINRLIDIRPDEQPLSTAYLIWREPWMTVGHDTYIHDVLQRWNLTNVFGNFTRYPEIRLDYLTYLEPELILLSSEPFPFKENHIAEVQKACPDARIMLVNGEWFSWYGSGMIQGFQQLNTWRSTIA